MKRLTPLHNTFTYIHSHFYFLTIGIYVLVLLGIFLRLYNLNWGAPYFFHPDERNIIYAVTRLNVTKNLNPEFFAYGSLPIYIIYFFSLVHNIIQNLIERKEIHFLVSFENAIITSRILSAFYSALTIFVVYHTTKLFTFSKKYQLLTVLFLLFNAGLIQYSHFGTFESFLTLFSALYCYFLVLFMQKRAKKIYILALISFAVLASSKISTIVFGIFLLLPLFILSQEKVKHKKRFLKISSLILHFVVLSTLSFLVFISFYIITNPFSILKFHDFQSSMSYESSVALGTLTVFYTGGFKESIPVLYQMLHVYPFLINPLGALLVLFSALFFLILIVKKRSLHNLFLTIPLLFFFCIFFSQAFLYVKWIRYYIPSIPFIYLLIIGISNYIPKVYQKYYNWILYCTLIISIIHTFAFCYTVYGQKDTRIAADEWSKNQIPKKAAVLSEVYDMGIVPFNDNEWDIELFDFYSLDEDPNAPQTLSEQLNKSHYIILPSTRVSRSRNDHRDIFPKGYAFYQDLNNTKKYNFLYQTPCNFICKISYYGNGLSYFEETSYVFDRPTVSIYSINK